MLCITLKETMSTTVSFKVNPHADLIMARVTKQTSLSSYGKKKTYRRPAGVPKSMSKSRKRSSSSTTKRYDGVARSNREYQTGRSNKRYDERRKAKLPGRRVSASGRVYYERRKNRSDTTGQRRKFSRR